MNNWTDKLKQLILPGSRNCIIIADNDGLFVYDELRQLMNAEGYEILTAKTELDVRIQYELKVRGRDVKTLLIAPPGCRPLPDIECEVNYRAVGLKDLFPNLDTAAIKGLTFNALSTIYRLKPYEVLSYDKTIKYLLEGLYGADLNQLSGRKSKEKILSLLITVMLEANGVNQPILGYLSEMAKPYIPEFSRNGFSREILTDFLQVNWNLFVESGSGSIDFEEGVLNRNMGHLFLSGVLSPVRVTTEKYEAFPDCLKFGITADGELSLEISLNGMLQYLNEQSGSIEDVYNEWFKIVQILAKAKLISIELENIELRKKYLEIERGLNARFQKFIDNSYGNLFSLTGVRHPIVISRVLEYLKAHTAGRKALLVIDGMNYWQYLMIEEALLGCELKVKRKSTLAYIPSITAWSRQALFKGNKPDLSKDNSSESSDFISFWKANGYLAHQIKYAKAGINDPLDFDSIPPDADILGIVCNDLDDIMHGAVLGNDQLKSSTSQWIQKSRVVNIIMRLKNMGYSVFITTDHGNIEATGIKNLKHNEKAGSLSRGKRYIYFDNEIMAANFKELNADLSCGMKGNSIYLRNYESFSDENVKIITHGGSHLWEVIIPFAEVI